MDFIESFAARVNILGPQMVWVEGIPYLCYTPIRGTQDWYIATTPHRYRLCRVNPGGAYAEDITAIDPPQGEMLPIERHPSVESILQILAEARLFDEEQLGLAEYASYILAVWTTGGLISTDDFVAALIGLLPSGATKQNLLQFKNDLSGSPRLRTTIAKALVDLASERIENYQSARG